MTFGLRAAQVLLRMVKGTLTDADRFFGFSRIRYKLNG